MRPSRSDTAASSSGTTSRRCTRRTRVFPSSTSFQRTRRRRDSRRTRLTIRHRRSAWGTSLRRCSAAGTRNPASSTRTRSDNLSCRAGSRRMRPRGSARRRSDNRHRSGIPRSRASGRMCSASRIRLFRRCRIVHRSHRRRFLLQRRPRHRPRRRRHRVERRRSRSPEDNPRKRC